MILPIYMYGQPVLRKQTDFIDPDYPELGNLIQDMFDTMYNAEGVGLAAPQIGLSISIFVVDASPLAEDFPECEGFKRVFINPEIEEFSEETGPYNEGCLSIPGINETVIRPTTITMRYQDEHFEEKVEQFSGFQARVLQHEFDHLEGHLFTERISPIRRQFVKAKLANIGKGKVACSYKVKR